MKIITITLSPAFDIHCSLSSLALHRENFAEMTSVDAGGKGINISRALTFNGVESLAFVILGNDNGDSFERALISDGIRYDKIYTAGRVRENITCHIGGEPETRISFNGFSVSEKLLKKTYESIIPEVDGGTVITFTGSVPSGLEMDSVKAFLRAFTDKGARIVIDSRSFSLDDLKDVKPWLIKPNQEEISEHLGRDIRTFDETISVAVSLHRSGISNVMISLGGDGAMLVCDDGIFVATPPKIDALSTIGAGDSSIAGFLAAAKSNFSSDMCLRTAVAYGSAACLTEGTRPPEKDDVDRMLPLIKLRQYQ